MTRLIDADALREEWLESGENEYVYDTNAVLYSIDSAPTIDAAPVRRGEWEKLVWGDAYDNRERRCYRCSRCNKENAVRRNFCPNCGADMRGVLHGTD